MPTLNVNYLLPRNTQQAHEYTWANSVVETLSKTGSKFNLLLQIVQLQIMIIFISDLSAN